MNPTLRTEQDELDYKHAPKNDIAKMKSQSFCGMRMIENQYPYTICHKDGLIFMAANGESFMEWWIRMGQAIQDGKVPREQFIYNISGQSQPHIPHGHGVNFKERKDFKL